MQVCYSALLDVYSEIEGILGDQGRLYYLYYAKEAVQPCNLISSCVWRKHGEFTHL